MDSIMILPPKDQPSNLDDIEKNTPFVTYVWERPLCPWCAQWLRVVDFRPIGLPWEARAGCPNFHGIWAFSQNHWVDVRPPANVARGGDGAWWTSVTIEELRARDNFC